jgi:DnaK suppressor protein
MAELSTSDVRHFEELLRARRETLREVLHAELIATRRDGYLEIAGQVQDVADESIAALLMGIDLSGRERELEEMHDLEGALERIAQGSYGVCIECRTQIDRERLDAYPTAKRCIFCQQRHERERNRGRDGTPSL